MKFGLVLFLSVLSSSEAFVLSCKFAVVAILQSDYKAYSCISKDSIAADDTTIERVNGEHLEYRNNADVKSFDIRFTDTLPTDLSKTFANLESIRLSGTLNVIKVTKSSFEGLTKLKRAEIKTNSLPQDIFDNHLGMEELILDLHTIDISRNPLGKLRKLKNIEIVVDDNSLITKELFQNNLNLEKIDLTSNNLQTIAADFFEELTKLEEIDLSFNELITLDPMLFKNNVKLREIDLTNNNLTFLDVNLFASNLNLKSIWIRQNKIKTLDGHLFKYNSLLETIILDDNEISLIGNELLSFLAVENLQRIDFQENICVSDSWNGEEQSFVEFKNMLIENCGKKIV
ncbi:unnamed protein product [Diamesa serratosioi]